MSTRIPAGALIQSLRRTTTPLRVALRAIAMALALVSIALAILTGCVGASDPASFYVIQPLPAITTNTSATSRTLAIGPVKLPRMLDRPQIVTELDGNQVNLSEQHRWAEDLGDNLARVLGQNLAMRLHGIDVRSTSVRPAADFRLNLAFDQFGGRLGKSARLTGVSRVADQRAACAFIGATAVAPAMPFNIEIAVAGPGYGDFVEALRQGVGNLSNQIAAQVARMPVTPPECGR